MAAGYPLPGAGNLVPGGQSGTVLGIGALPPSSGIRPIQATLGLAVEKEMAPVFWQIQAQGFHAWNGDPAAAIGDAGDHVSAVARVPCPLRMASWLVKSAVMYSVQAVGHDRSEKTERGKVCKGREAHLEAVSSHGDLPQF